MKCKIAQTDYSSIRAIGQASSGIGGRCANVRPTRSGKVDETVREFDTKIELGAGDKALWVLAEGTIKQTGPKTPRV